ncbi:nucleotidyltransferase family protein [Brevibacillus sp. SYP-B805]|uniref:nucleotidyltransferase family protein n=1 Tax=Brevibacillus sp. SYP-B805 TaxID=1578199 RepID=UPI001F497B86|nr:nucleotidyltransferase family protein [Brevibacillus sp. SYP-B805]
MSNLNRLIIMKRNEILQIASRHGAKNLRIFGSQVKETAQKDSDIDVLVEFEEGRSLLDRIALIQDLEDLLGMKVDVVSEKALHPVIRDQILQEAVPL